MAYQQTKESTSDALVMNDVETTLQGKHLTFSIDESVYGLEIRYVKDIVGVSRITAVPGMPDNIRGVMRLRGSIVPVMDVRMRFSMPFRPYTDHTCVIMVIVSGVWVGLIVDGVNEVVTIDASDLITPARRPATGDQRFLKDIARVGERTVLLIDCMRLLSQDGFAMEDFAGETRAGA